MIVMSSTGSCGHRRESCNNHNFPVVGTLRRMAISTSISITFWLSLASSIRPAIAAAAAPTGADNKPASSSSSSAAAFGAEGPILTVTLKDSSSSSSTDDDDDEVDSRHATSSQQTSDWLRTWLRPTLLYNINSRRSPPFPKHLPAIKNIQAAIGYNHHHHRHDPTTTNDMIPPFFYFPTWFELVAKIEMGRRKQLLPGGDDADVVQIQVQPSWNIAHRSMNLLVQAVHGSNYAFVRWSSPTSPKSKKSNDRVVAAATMMVPTEIKASCYFPHAMMPSGLASSIDSVRVTPSWRQGTGCHLQVEAAVAGSGGTGPGSNTNNKKQKKKMKPTTKLILNYHHHHDHRRATQQQQQRNQQRHRQSPPMLAVQYQPNENHLLRPEINLLNGHIIYHYICKLGSATTTASSSSSSPSGDGDNSNQIGRRGGGTGAGIFGSFAVKVDPMKAIEMTWIDPGIRGSWMTDITIPLLVSSADDREMNRGSGGSSNDCIWGTKDTLSQPRIRIRRFIQL